MIIAPIYTIKNNIAINSISKIIKIKLAIVKVKIRNKTAWTGFVEIITKIEANISIKVIKFIFYNYYVFFNGGGCAPFFFLVGYINF